MNSESGRSLIEMLGVLAIGAIISFGAIKMYQSVRARQVRFVAEQELKSLSENAKILFVGRQDYTGISKSYLIKAGALKTEFIAGHDFKVISDEGGKSFRIVFEDFDFGECAYFSTVKLSWADKVTVNGFSEEPSDLCAKSAPNRLEITVN